MQSLHFLHADYFLSKTGPKGHKRFGQLTILHPQGLHGAFNQIHLDHRRLGALLPKLRRRQAPKNRSLLGQPQLQSGETKVLLFAGETGAGNGDLQ